MMSSDRLYRSIVRNLTETDTLILYNRYDRFAAVAVCRHTARYIVMVTTTWSTTATGGCLCRSPPFLSHPNVDRNCFTWWYN